MVPHVPGQVRLVQAIDRQQQDTTGGGLLVR
jgi:hypothetical protein